MKNLFRKLTMMTLMLISIGSFYACSSDDDSIPGRPIITALEGVNRVVLGESKDFTFNVEIPGGYKSHSFIAARGSIIETPKVVSPGDRQASLVVNFQGLDQGAAVIQLTVTDSFNQTDTKSMTIEVFESN